MGRNYADFHESTQDDRLGDNATCEQGNCKKPATKFSWSDGNSCTDCHNANQNAANTMRSAGIRKKDS